MAMLPSGHPITAEEPVLLLVNSTKLMDFQAPRPSRLATTDPSFAGTAQELVQALSRHDARRRAEARPQGGTFPRGAGAVARVGKKEKGRQRRPFPG